MTTPSFHEMMAKVYIGPPPAVKELNLSDEWRGRWVEADALPAGLPVDHVYCLVYMGDRAYASRPSGDDRWGMVEFSPTGEKLATAVKKAVRDQTGGTVSALTMVGYIACRATRHHPNPGSGTTRPIFVAVLKSISDLGRDALYQRRRFPLNEYLAALRQRYPEIRPYVDEAASRYVAIRAKAAV